MIVYIPSKGRSKIKNWEKIKEAGFNFVVAVEPQDEQDYRSAGTQNLIVMDRNDAGLAYCRNYALDWCRRNGHDWMWMVDDDVTGYGGIDSNGKTVKMSSSVLGIVYEKLKQFKFPVGGISYRQFCWGKLPSYRINRQSPDVCTLIYLPKIKWRYNESLTTKIDRDFFLKSIKYSDGMITLPRYCFSTPKMGSNVGGLHDIYAQKKYVEDASRMISYWGSEYITLARKNGKLDIDIDWKGFAAANHRKIHP